MNNSANRKIDILAKEKFRRNCFLSIKYLLENTETYNFEEYYIEFKNNEKAYVDMYLYSKALEKNRENPLPYYKEMINKLLPIASQQKIVIKNENIQNLLNDYKTGLKGAICFMAIPIPAIIVICLTIIGIMVKSVLLTILPIVFFSIGLFLLLKLCKKVETKSNIKYHILKDVCVKKVEIDGGSGEGGGDDYYLHFKKSGKCRLHTVNCQEFSQFSLFFLTEEGDEFYLLKTQDNQIRIIYPAKKCEIEKDDFTEKDDIFLPL